MQLFNTSLLYSIGAAYQPTAFLTATFQQPAVLTNDRSMFRMLNFTAIQRSDTGKYNFCTVLGSTKYCLDQLGGDKTSVTIQLEGNFTGQQWTLHGIDQPDGSTFWKMQTDYAGPTSFLTVIDRNLTMIDNGPENATLWRLVDSSSIALSSNNATTTNSSPVPTSTAKADGDHRPAVAVPVIIGAVMGVLGFLILSLIAVVFFIKRRKRKRLGQLEAIATIPPSMTKPAYSTSLPQLKPMADLRVPDFPSRPDSLLAVSPNSQVSEVESPQKAYVSRHTLYELPSAFPSRPPPGTQLHELDGQRSVRELEG